VQASAPFRKIVTGISVFFGICIIGVIGYVSAGWLLTDSIYMVIITIFGVGYGEVQPVQSPWLRALTIMVIITGYASVIYTVGGFMQMLIDGELNRALGARRMAKGIEQLSNHTIICGLGRLGSILAKELHEAGKPFVAIDLDLPRIQAAEQLGYWVLHGDATEEHILEQSGIRRAAMVAAVMSADAINVFVTITAREMNPQVTIIARGENPRTEKKLISSGADKVILPAAIGAHKVAQLIIRPSAEDFLEQLAHRSSVIEELNHLGLEVSEATVTADSQLVNQPLSKIEFQSKRGLLIVGVRKRDGTSQLNPPENLLLDIGDTLILLGHQRDVAKVLRQVSQASPQLTYRGVKIDSQHN
jgi:voltage-gated potassium channel